jgi:L-iditol 2-dehydrogenase
MKAAVFHSVGDIRIEDVEKPAIGPDEVLVKPRSVGICGSDKHIFAGHWKIETPRFGLDDIGKALAFIGDWSEPAVKIIINP